MRVRFLQDMAIRGTPVKAGEVGDVPDDDLWRLEGRYEPEKRKLNFENAPPEEIEERDPEPATRDPKLKKK
jgi:hypothetical protein